MVRASGEATAWNRPTRSSPGGDRRGKVEPGLALGARAVEETLRRLPVFLRRKLDRAPWTTERVELDLVRVRLSVALPAGVYKTIGLVRVLAGSCARRRMSCGASRTS